VAESAAQSAERERLARLAADRRAAVTMLQIAASTCRYAAGQLAGEAAPAEARAAALFVAGDLAATAEALLRLTPARSGRAAPAGRAAGRAGHDDEADRRPAGRVGAGGAVLRGRPHAPRPDSKRRRYRVGSGAVRAGAG
jgi:hypothetical protein